MVNLNITLFAMVEKSIMDGIFIISYLKLAVETILKVKRWKEELSHQVNSSNMDSDWKNYLAQELELDAFAFTKYYLKEYESIETFNKIDGFDEYIDRYIILFKSIFN